MDVRCHYGEVCAVVVVVCSTVAFVVVRLVVNGGLSIVDFVFAVEFVM